MAIDKQQHYNPLNITTMTKKSSKVNNETKVMCPVCGSEFAIGEHEHHVKDATVIGQDSGLGDVFLQVSKRGDALKAAGIDTGKYFSINLPTGGSQMMKMDDEGKAVPVTADDPIVQAIINGGTVPNKNLFRRWIMSQTFHGLMANGGYAKWLKWHGYIYTWEMLVKELHDQTKLAGRDAENFNARNRWYNLDLCVAMATDYIKQVKADAKSRKTGSHAGSTDTKNRTRQINRCHRNSDCTSFRQRFLHAVLDLIIILAFIEDVLVLLDLTNNKLSLIIVDIQQPLKLSDIAVFFSCCLILFKIKRVPSNIHRILEQRQSYSFNASGWNEAVQLLQKSFHIFHPVRVVHIHTDLHPGFMSQ